MSATLKSFASHINPKPNHFDLERISNSNSMALFKTPSPSLRLGSLFRPHSHRVSIVTRCDSLRGFEARFLSIDCRRLKYRSIVSLSASHEDLKLSEIEAEKKKNEFGVRAEESQKAWKQMLESFKEQAIKMHGLSQEAYDLYSKKAMVILKETSEQLKIQAEKASYDLSIMAKEISEEGKEFLSTTAEKSPEGLKEIVQTFASSTDDLKEVSKVRDFYLGIPYGAILSLGGFLSFMLTGSISAVRFGVVLGGILLALSISSLISWKRGETSALALKGQVAIATIIFLREMRLLSQRPLFTSSLMTFISGAMVIFYLYRNMLDGDQNKAPSTINGLGN